MCIFILAFFRQSNFGSGEGQGQGEEEKEGIEVRGWDKRGVGEEEEEEEAEDGLHWDLTVRGSRSLIFQPKPKLWQRYLRRDCSHERVWTGLLTIINTRKNQKQLKVNSGKYKTLNFQMYQTSEYLEPKEGLEMFDPHQVGAEKSWMLRLIFFHIRASTWSR